jgi:hypothetical protein
MEQPLIDADGHVIEDETLMDYLEKPYRSGKTQGGIIGPIRNVAEVYFPPWTSFTWRSQRRGQGGHPRWQRAALLPNPQGAVMMGRSALAGLLHDPAAGRP